MVTKEELEKQKFEESHNDKASYMVSKEEMAMFDEDASELPSDVDTVIFDYCQSLEIKRVNSQIAEYIHTNEKTLREYLNGKRKITRQFLYKLTIGLALTREQADELFMKCGGKLNPLCREDYIVLRAIEDDDSIKDFIENFNDNVPDYSKII